MSEAPQAAETQFPLIVGIRFQKIGKPRKAEGGFIAQGRFTAQLSAVARRLQADEAIPLRQKRQLT